MRPHSGAYPLTMARVACHCQGTVDDTPPARGETLFRFCDGKAGCGYVFDRRQQRWRFFPGLDLNQPPDPDHLEVPLQEPYRFGWTGHSPTSTKSIRQRGTDSKRNRCRLQDERWHVLLGQATAPAQPPYGLCERRVRRWQVGPRSWNTERVRREPAGPGSRAAPGA